MEVEPLNQRPAYLDALQRNVPDDLVRPGDGDGLRAALLALASSKESGRLSVVALWRLGDARFEQELQRIDQWWQGHRGDFWHPVHPEAPGFVQR